MKSERYGFTPNTHPRPHRGQNGGVGLTRRLGTLRRSKKTSSGAFSVGEHWDTPDARVARDSSQVFGGVRAKKSE